MKRESGRCVILSICALASSSSGNAAFLRGGQTRILVDAGLSRKETFRRLHLIGEDPGRLDAIVITHEHSDHVAGLVRIARTLDVPVYVTQPTAAAIDWGECAPRLAFFQAGGSFRIGDIAVSTFTIPHDAVDPVGLCFECEGVKAAIVTDLGYLPESIAYHLRGVDFLLLESNHDVEMLKVGPYPWAVKQRVMSRRGHLSNELVSDFIQKRLDASVSTLVLGHLSEHNNHPEIARITALQALEERGLKTRLVVAEPAVQTEVFTFA